MRYHDVELSFDNFRSVLKEFSVDIQDVVRSAIMDAVDLSPYILACKNDSYKLDQIRLSIKEGLNSSIFVFKGETIKNIRKLKGMGYPIQNVEVYTKCTLSEVHEKYLIQWLYKGYSIPANFCNIDLELLPVFNEGYSYGYDMSKLQSFNGTAEYLRCLMDLLKMGVDTKKFMSGWDLDCLRFVVTTIYKCSNNSVTKFIGLCLPSDSVDMLSAKYNLASALVNVPKSEYDIGWLLKQPIEVISFLADAINPRLGIYPKSFAGCKTLVQMQSLLVDLTSKSTVPSGGKLTRKG